MSRIDDLIQELCPAGVEHRPLGELGHFIRGRRFTKSDYVNAGIPSIHYGEIYTGSSEFRWGVSGALVA